jgi:hypothetical protein
MFVWGVWVQNPVIQVITWDLLAFFSVLHLVVFFISFSLKRNTVACGRLQHSSWCGWGHLWVFVGVALLWARRGRADWLHSDRDVQRRCVILYNLYCTIDRLLAGFFSLSLFFPQLFSSVSFPSKLPQHGPHVWASTLKLVWLGTWRVG